MAHGVIARIVADKGFGFISIDGEHNDSDVFFHRSSLVDTRFESLTVGMRVSFNLGKGPKGQRAEDVRVGM